MIAMAARTIQRIKTDDDTKSKAPKALETFGAYSVAAICYTLFVKLQELIGGVLLAQWAVVTQSLVRHLPIGPSSRGRASGSLWPRRYVRA